MSNVLAVRDEDGSGRRFNHHSVSTEPIHDILVLAGVALYGAYRIKTDLCALTNQEL
jgi:hypothetical protein